MALDATAVSATTTTNTALTIEQAAVQAVEKAPQPWPLLFVGLFALAGLAAVGYLLVESVSYGNHTAGVYLGSVIQWAGLGALVAGAIAVPSPIGKG